METQLRLLRIVWGGLLASILMYVVVGENVGPNHTPNPVFFRAIALVSVVTIAMLFVVRRTMIAPVLLKLRNAPGDQAALNRWRGGYIVTYALSEAVALFGFVLRMQGFTLTQVAPFYIGGLLLMVFFRPRRPVSNDMSTGASTMG